MDEEPSVEKYFFTSRRFRPILGSQKGRESEMKKFDKIKVVKEISRDRMGTVRGTQTIPNKKKDKDEHECWERAIRGTDGWECDVCGLALGNW